MSSPFSLTKYGEIFDKAEGYFCLIYNNQPAEMIVVKMGRSSLSKVVCFVFDSGRLHSCCCFCWTVRWSYGLKCQQCEGIAWNCSCWRSLNFYRMRMNPTSQSWTQISTDSCEGYAGRCFETSFVLAHANRVWPMPIRLSIFWIVKLAQDLIILTLVTIHNSFWWLIDRKQCNQFQLFCCLIIRLISGWFAQWLL